VRFGEPEHRLDIFDRSRSHYGRHVPLLTRQVLLHGAGGHAIATKQDDACGQE
jgi:hypothetical protein